MNAFEMGLDMDLILCDMRTYETLDDARLLAQDILAKALDANVGCALIASIGAKLRYPESLEAFAAFAHDQAGHEHVGITEADCVDDILDACRAFLQSASNDRGAS
jgi:hypothetical protein